MTRPAATPLRAAHTIHSMHSHCGWDNALAPVLTVAPGEAVEFDVIDASGGQLTAASTAADVPAVDPARVNPVTGPVRVDGARPGDVLAVSVLQFAPSGWGWTANIPGFGLLADEFPDPALHHWHYHPSCTEPALFGPGGRVRCRPFAGTMGVAPAAAGTHGVIPPRRVGGNMDVRDLVAGSVLHLPVEIDGALFSVGDTHAAQGDGEVCGTAIESPMRVALRFDLLRDRPLAYPRFSVPAMPADAQDLGPREVTTGIGPDLMGCARDAVRGMIDLLCARYGMNAVDAYLLCSVCADLRIAEAVDAPNWVVCCHFPLAVFE